MDGRFDFLICKSAFFLQNIVFFEKQKERYLEAKQYIEDFIQRYPTVRLPVKSRITTEKLMQIKINGLW